MEKIAGKVYLVGAGPGTIELLTVKGQNLIKNADVIVYDRLVSEDILSIIPEEAEKIYVGKNAGNHFLPQDKINEILVEKAFENKMVVRLKGGDPFVFGRGGEELELLIEKNIPFEVVPGITSAISVATYAGIPVTHRECCSSLHIITGHGKSNTNVNIDYASLVKLNGTLIFMMSVSLVKDIKKGLIDGGINENTKVAVVENGTRPEQRKFIGEIKNIEKIIEENKVKSPAIIIVGDVCKYSNEFDWYSKKALKGLKILVTRPKNTSGKLSNMLSDLGADVKKYPCIKTEKIKFFININYVEWILFTSAIGVDSFFEQLLYQGMDSRSLYGKKFAVVGPETSNQLKKYGITSDFVPKIYDAEHLAKGLIENNYVYENTNVSLYRAKKGTEEIISILKEKKVNISDICVYKTHFINNEKIDIREYDYVTFTSISCVEAFLEVNKDVDFSSIKAICIGSKTAYVAKKAGLMVHIAKKATIECMVEKIIEVQNGK